MINLFNNDIRISLLEYTKKLSIEKDSIKFYAQV